MKNTAIQKRTVLAGRKKSCAVSAHLYRVVDTFINLQDQRIRADYSTGEDWDRTDTLHLIAEAESAFESWKAVRNESEAQAFLVSMLGTRTRSDHS